MGCHPSHWLIFFKMVKTTNQVVWAGDWHPCLNASHVHMSHTLISCFGCIENVMTWCLIPSPEFRLETIFILKEDTTKIPNMPNCRSCSNQFCKMLQRCCKIFLDLPLISSKFQKCLGFMLKPTEICVTTGKNHSDSYIIYIYNYIQYIYTYIMFGYCTVTIYVIRLL